MDILDTVIVVATIVNAIATVVLAVFALVQWRSFQYSVVEQGKARSASVFLEVYDLMGRLRPRWHQLYALPDDFNQWDRKQRQLADEVGTELQRVAYLCEKGLVEPSIVIESYGKVFVQCWDKLEGFIKDYRVRSGEPAQLEEGAYQRKHLELFARRCRRALFGA